MKILHTADWHLGARLVDHDRGEEHQCFLDWLLEHIRGQGIDLLIVAGDVFDSANPPQAALTQYYQFLASLVSTTKCETLIIGGNHDSAATLNAPRELLRSLRVHVHGSAAANHEHALHEYADVIVCAVPFLRERDVRIATAGQTYDEVATQVREGIMRHYQTLLQLARTKAGTRPIIATGHLTAMGVQSASSERQIHIGNLGAVGADCFEGFHYNALGHIHRPQHVGGSEFVRYVGSPILLSFDERGSPKQVLVIEVKEGLPISIQPVPLPIWRQLLSVSSETAGLPEALAAVKALAPDGSLKPWIELTIEDPVPPTDLDQLVRKAATEAGVAVLKVIRPIPVTGAAASLLAGRDLHETTPTEVFAEMLRREGIGDDSDDYKELTETFSQLLMRMEEETSA